MRQGPTIVSGAGQAWAAWATDPQDRAADPAGAGGGNHAATLAAMAPAARARTPPAAVWSAAAGLRAWDPGVQGSAAEMRSESAAAQGSAAEIRSASAAASGSAAGMRSESVTARGSVAGMRSEIATAQGAAATGRSAGPSGGAAVAGKQAAGLPVAVGDEPAPTVRSAARAGARWVGAGPLHRLGWMRGGGCVGACAAGQGRWPRRWPAAASPPPARHRPP